MEPTSSERSRRTRPRQPIRKSFAESPPPRTSHKKRRRKEETSSEYYLVKDILAEKKVDEQIFFLIDWEDNAETGGSYEPTWVWSYSPSATCSSEDMSLMISFLQEPYDNVKQEAIADWEYKKWKRDKQARRKERRAERKKRKAEKREREAKLADRSQKRSSTSDTDSQPIRTAKRRKISYPPDSTAPNQTPKPRRAGTAETARFQSVSQETVDSQGIVKEIKDSYEEEEQLSNRGGNVSVVVPRVGEAFDRDAYAILATSSQPSQITQPSQSPVYPTSQSQHKLPTATRRPFLWDEPAPVIPDSQELTESPSQTAVSKTGVTTQPDSGTNTQSELDPFQETQSGFSNISGDSCSIRDRHPVQLNHPSGSHPPVGDSEVTSSEPASGAKAPSSGGQESGTSGESDRPTQPQKTDKLEGTVDSSSQSVGLVARPGTAGSAFSEPPITSTHSASSVAQIPGTRSAEPARGLEQVGSHQESQSEVDTDSLLQFQTQVPFPNFEEPSNSQAARDHVIQGYVRRSSCLPYRLNR
jgi:hypothetical protein